MQRDLLDEEKPKAKNQRTVRLIGDVLMIITTALILVQLAGYPFLRPDADSLYLPDYAYDYTYGMAVYKMIVLSSGLLLAQVFKLLNKPYPALFAVSSGILIFFLFPYLAMAFGL